MDELTFARCGSLIGTLDDLADQWVKQLDLTTFDREDPLLKAALMVLLRGAYSAGITYAVDTIITNQPTGCRTDS